MKAPKKTNPATTRIHVSTSFLYFKKDSTTFLVYWPAFDLLAGGHTEEEAKHSLQVTLSADLRVMKEENTLRDEFMRLGWKILKWSPLKKEIVPPTFTSGTIDNPVVRELINENSFRKKTPLLHSRFNVRLG